MARVLGLNARNAHIARRSSRRAIVDAKDKALTKHRLAAAGVPVPDTLALVANHDEIGRMAWRDLPDCWVMKPVRGSRGRGVLVVTGRSGRDDWTTPGGPLTVAGARAHAVGIVDGEHSREGDAAIVEPLLVAHEALAPFAPVGLPDVRVICDAGVPLMAMLRLPTVASGGRGNLHQGGIGAAIDLATGRIERAVRSGVETDVHPDTGARIAGLVVPSWATVLEAAITAGPATGLGYVGVDLVVDAERGPLVLEVNSHPGLEIQNVTGRPIVLPRAGGPVVASIRRLGGFAEVGGREVPRGPRPDRSCP